MPRGVLSTPLHELQKVVPEAIISMVLLMVRVLLGCWISEAKNLSRGDRVAALGFILYMNYAIRMIILRELSHNII